MSAINFFAKTNFRNQQRVFGIKEDDRRRHMYVIGKTGMGKSNLLENMAVQDIKNGKGVCVVDPHGEFAEKMIKSIPSNRINDVVYFNPADLEFPIAFNILESVSEDKKNLVASGMMGVFKKIWPDVWSPRMEYILNNTILALLDYPGSTMLGVNRMMSDKDFRKRIYPKIKDPVVKSFWLNEFEKWEDRFRKEAVAAIQNKVGQFLSSPIIRHIVGQPKSSIDMREIMDNEKILIVNLSKGRIGEDAMRLLGGMIVTKLQLAAMGRVDIPESERKDFYLYVDEFQNFATESFANILSEARKYRLSLILAHQYINQLIFDGNSTVRDAIFGNVGTLVSFRVGAEDAEFLEKEFEPVFMMNDIVNLSKYDIYLKLMIDGISGDAFSARTLPPIDSAETLENTEKVISVSRERYGRSRREIEERITRWSGMFDYDELEKRGMLNNAEKKEREMIQPRANGNVQRERNDISRKNNNVAPVRNFTPRKEINFIQKQNHVSDEKRIESRADESLDKQIMPEQKKKEAKQLTEQLEKQKAEEVGVVQKIPKKMFDAVCSNCEENIQVPFEPDPNRPAFCRECLKDHQRLRAKMQREKELMQNQSRDVVVAPKNIDRYPKEKDMNFQPSSFSSNEKPMSLNQMSHIAPKKFTHQKRRPQINRAEIKDLIDRSKGN